MDCDYWVRDLAAREPSLREDEAGHGSQRLSCAFAFQPKVQTVDEVIEEAELKLISIGDYSDVQFRTRTKEEVREDLSPFLPSHWLSTSPLMCVLSLFGWGESTTVLHSKHTEFDINDAEKRKEMLDGPVWPIGRKHTRIIIPHNPCDHWILIVVDIPIRTISYYSSLPGYHLRDCCEFVEAQMKRVGEYFGQDYSGWNSPFEGVSTLSPSHVQSADDFIEFTSTDKWLGLRDIPSGECETPQPRRGRRRSANRGAYLKGFLRRIIIGEVSSRS